MEREPWQLKKGRSGLVKAGPVAEYLETTVSNLARLRFEGRGPAYVRLGRSIRYRWEDVERWVEESVIGGDVK
jgi:hypothetical protein